MTQIFVTNIESSSCLLYHQNFSLTPEDGGVLNPHEKIDLTLTFCPKSIGKVAAKLNIKVLTEQDEIIEVFVIPIKGETLDLPISVSGK